jgi:toxin ParE1/3/4
MAVKIIWTTLALEDIKSIAEFIAKDSERYSQIQTSRFFERTKILESQPEFGRVVPEIGIQSVRQLNEGN